ncbi:hypothetical protein EN749_27520 [Mesorhizobium sp. M7A.F.Ca.ET.027.02.1.1]|uniref:hypothetical protein n=1 Tax=Mesorhizobium sp. M7A.F.Ca.ET.027.02.1.1 TaxID=2496655 RepID=UPI000FD51804|nr:hypothetical protein [Mesorhizobium sp. M7A.F.Ca.ET.027.02.1.1]RVD12445.1 hypothetical protein EN749_27520 [Mesorhizobium sp. M7A.F.Ca.ET.027.02.1.1]
MERGEIAGSASMLWVPFLPGGIDPFRQKPDLCQSSTGKRSRQRFKAASVTFNNERQRHQIEEKVVDRMCERIRPLFELKRQGARLFDRGPAIVCLYQGVNPIKDLQAFLTLPKSHSAQRTPLVSAFSTKEHGRVSPKGIARQSGR